MSHKYCKSNNKIIVIYLCISQLLFTTELSPSLQIGLFPQQYLLQNYQCRPPPLSFLCRHLHLYIPSCENICQKTLHVLEIFIWSIQLKSIKPVSECTWGEELTWKVWQGEVRVGVVAWTHKNGIKDVARLLSVPVNGHHIPLTSLGKVWPLCDGCHCCLNTHTHTRIVCCCGFTEEQQMCLYCNWMYSVFYSPLCREKMCRQTLMDLYQIS